MKRMTRAEYDDRMEAIFRAKKIFVDTGVTNNISEAFAMYQELFAERERQIFISEQNTPIEYLNPLAKFERPECPECGSVMQFRILPEEADPEVKSQLVCTNQACDTVLDSSFTLDDWIEYLRKETKEADEARSRQAGPKEKNEE